MPELDPHSSVGQNARLIARRKLEEFSGWGDQAASPYAVKDLHQLRIAAKRLRYTLEIFAEVLPEACTSVVEEVTAIQDELGELHDSDVLIALLRLCLSSQDNPTYAQMLSCVQNNKGGTLEPALVAALLDPSTTPTVLISCFRSVILLGVRRNGKEKCVLPGCKGKNS